MPAESNPGPTLSVGTNLRTDSFLCFFPPAPCQGMQQLLLGVLGDPAGSFSQAASDTGNRSAASVWVAGVVLKRGVSAGRDAGPDKRVVLQDGASV